MSDTTDTQETVVNDENNTSTDPVDTPKETTPETKTVNLDVHQRTSQDMMKYKGERNALQQELNAIKTANEAKKIAELEEKENWKEVAKLNAQKLQKLEDEKESLHSSMMEGFKKSAVIEGVGGFSNPSYADLAINYDNITINDGAVDQESLKLEVDRIKRDHRVLLKSTTSSQLPNTASNPEGNKTTEKPWKEMNKTERYLEMKRLTELKQLEKQR